MSAALPPTGAAQQVVIRLERHMGCSEHFLRDSLRIAVFGLAVCAPLNVACAADIKILGGSAVIPPMEVLISQFERTSGHRVIADFDGAIGAMTKRIQAGEAADVVIVSRQQIESLEKDGKVLAGTRTDFARLGVGVFVRKGAPKPDISSVEAFKRTLLTGKSIGYNDPAAGAPVSIYLAGLFERLGIAAEMSRKTVVFKQRSERFAAVARGDVEIGFNQISEILAVPDVDLVGPLPQAIQNYTDFAAAVVSNSKHPDVARQFVTFIASPAAISVMKAKGFE
jgi:molybdate transport system substrate-binding protein